MIGAAQIHVERALPVGVLAPEDQAVDGDAGVVDEDVQRPLGGDDFLEGGVDGGGVRHVEALGRRRSTGGDDGGHGLGGGRLVGRVVDDDLGARAPQRDGDGPPDPAGTAGDDRDLAFEFTHLIDPPPHLPASQHWPQWRPDRPPMLL